MADDVGALLTLRIIDSGNIDDRNELTHQIVAKELERLKDPPRIDSQREFAERKSRFNHRGRHRGGKFRCNALKLLVHSPKSRLCLAPAWRQRSIVPIHLIWVCRINT